MKKILVFVAALVVAWIAGTVIAMVGLNYANAGLVPTEDYTQTVQSTEKVQATMRVQVTDDTMQKTVNGNTLQPAYNVNMVE